MKFLNIYILILLVFSTLNTKSTNNMKKGSKVNNIYLLSNTNWDTLDVNLIWATSSLFYFVNDSSLIYLESVHELVDDSLVCCIENVGYYKGSYFKNNDNSNHIRINLEKINFMSLDSNFIISDTLKFADKNDTLYFNNKLYIRTTKVVDETYIRLNYCFNSIVTDSMRKQIFNQYKKYNLTE